VSQSHGRPTLSIYSFANAICRRRRCDGVSLSRLGRQNCFVPPMSRCVTRDVPVSHYRIAPQDSLQRPTIYRQKFDPLAGRPGRDEFLPVNCRPGETFLEGDPMTGRLFYGAGDILIRGIYQILDYLPRADFSWGDISM